MKQEKKSLSRTEAIMVDRHFSALGIEVDGGWIGYFRLTPKQVAELRVMVEHGVSAEDVIMAARRPVDKKGE